MPASPEWANLPKRKCDDCGRSYKPFRPRLEGELGFCSANCRKSYHKHGGAYRKLKAEAKKMLEAEVRKMEKRFREIVREEIRADEQRREDLQREIADTRRAS
jgi:hypothetical protein